MKNNSAAAATSDAVGMMRARLLEALCREDREVLTKEFEAGKSNYCTKPVDFVKDEEQKSSKRPFASQIRTLRSLDTLQRQ